MSSPMNHPAGWLGGELLRRRDWLRHLSAVELSELRDAVRHATATGKSVEQLRRSDFPLQQLRQTLEGIQHDLEHGSGACLLKGLDISQYDELSARCLFWGISTYIGTAVSQSALGEKIFSVRDEGFQVGQPQARGPNTRKGLNGDSPRLNLAV